MSLRVRLLIATAATMLVALVVVDVATYVTVTRGQLTQVDQTLERAHSPVELVAVSPQDWQLIPTVAPGLLVAIVDPDGNPLYVSDGARPGRQTDAIDLSTVDLDKRLQSVSSVSGDEVRVRVDELDDGAMLIVGESLHEVNETTSALLSVLIGASLAAIAIAIGLAWLLVRAGLAPLRRVETSAAAINDDALGDERVPGANTTTEVGRLATALNAMLDRLDRSRVDRERSMHELQQSESRMRRFVADASHELRTPVAATAAYAELFEHGARDRPADLERAMRGIRNETQRMGELVDDLLLLARLDEKRPLGEEPVDMVEVVMESVDAARTVDPDRVIRPHIHEVVTVVGDRLRLRQVVDNLLANVRAHTPPGVSCDVTLDRCDDGVVLTVSDTGPGVPTDALANLFDRFYRFDEARTRSTGGNGLGLAIVEAIVTAHGGSIVASANEPHGLVVSVNIPHMAVSTPDDVADLDDVHDLDAVESSESGAPPMTADRVVT
jgi:two-component system OmpR family sensor kinase